MMAGMRDDIKASLAAGVPFPKRLGHPGIDDEIMFCCFVLHQLCMIDI